MIIDPFTLFNSTIDELTDALNKVTKEISGKDQENSVEIADTIVLLSDAKTIAGEILARCEYEYENEKATYEVEYGESIKKERELWSKEHPDRKHPAAAYFDRLALGAVHDRKTSVNEKKKMLTSYRKLHENYETRINAMKRLQDRMINVGY